MPLVGGGAGHAEEGVNINTEVLRVRGIQLDRRKSFVRTGRVALCR